MNHLSPMGIMILLQIHVFPFKRQQDMLNGSVAADFNTSYLLKEGLIKPEPRCPPPNDELEHGERSEWTTTMKGRVHIAKLCEMEFPVPSWT